VGLKFMLEQALKTESCNAETVPLKNRGLVSVVVPVYNVEQYIDRCIESIVNQTYRQLEIIMVDDGSTDGCPDICDKWALKDNRISVIHKTNAGLGMARNTGIDNAKGEYICFFDSDDYIELETIEKCISSAKDNGSDLVLFGFCDAFANGEIKPLPITDSRSVYKNDDILNRLLPDLLINSYGLDISACAKMFRLDLIRNNGISFKSEREIISEDAFFIIELFKNVMVASIVPESLYYYYKSSGSLTRTYREDRQAKNDIFLQKTLEYVQNNAYPDIVSRAVTACYHGYTIGAIKQIFAADTESGIKGKALKKIFKNSFLLNTLKPEIIAIEKRSLKLFWYALKYRQYWFCKLLLLYRLKVKK